MSERYTQKDAKLAFYMLANACQKEIVTGGSAPQEQTGKWRLSSEHGKHIIQELENAEGGVSHPFGHTTRNNKEFCAFVSATLHGIQIGKEQNRGE